MYNGHCFLIDFYFIKVKINDMLFENIFFA